MEARSRARPRAAPERGRFIRRVPGGGEPPWRGRVYVGDEFCERLLPCGALLEWAAAGGAAGGLTLMTPPLADRGMARVELLIERLIRLAPAGFEVVANDWGALALLRELRAPGVEPVCGRLLSSRTMFFDGLPADFLELVAACGVRRVEFNSIGHLKASSAALEERGMKAHLHWPCLYLSVSRCCPADAGPARTLPQVFDACAMGCGRGPARARMEDGAEVILRGNALLAPHPEPTPPPEADRIVEDPPDAPLVEPV